MGTDLTQPATAAEFQAAGVDATTAANLAAQHELMCGRTGTRDQQIELAIGMRNYVPPANPPAPAGKVTPADATAALEAHTNAHLAQELSAVMAAPLSASEYRFPSSDHQTDAQYATDREVAAALHAEGFPVHIVSGIGRDLASAAATRANETPQQAQARIAAVSATLGKWYGPEKDANLQLVDGLLARLIARGGATKSFVESAAAHLDAASIDSLVQFAKHGAKGR